MSEQLFIGEHSLFLGHFRDTVQHSQEVLFHMEPGIGRQDRSRGERHHLLHHLVTELTQMQGLHAHGHLKLQVAEQNGGIPRIVKALLLDDGLEAVQDLLQGGRLADAKVVFWPFALKVGSEWTARPKEERLVDGGHVLLLTAKWELT